MLGAQAVNAACVDGSAQELVHLILWVHVFLRVPENEMPESQKTHVFKPKVNPIEDASKSTFLGAFPSNITEQIYSLVFGVLKSLRGRKKKMKRV